jgi:hypothetical protein
MPQYNVNWARFAAYNLPIDLRKIKIFSYLLSLMQPIVRLHADFKQFRKEQLYEAMINGQVIKLERVLNDTFDPIDRRIYITDGDTYEPPVFYEEYKNQPVIFYEEGNPDNPVFYSDSTSGNVISFNFYVHVPESVFTEYNRIRATVNKYRARGRTFEIIII